MLHTDLRRREDGFTGLEAAIVLIAFIVVAAVFSFVVLKTGFHATEEGQYAIYKGVQQAGSGLEVSGTIYGVKPVQQEQLTIKSILIPISVPPGGAAVDVGSMSVRFVSPSFVEELRPNDPLMHAYPKDGCWSVQETYNNDNALLEPGERFLINITPTSMRGLHPNMQFTVEMKPAEGAPLRVVRRVPPHIDPVNELH
ncbi:flagellin flab1 [hydrocarbon metagenome]|uniref:Flagellin flab1 n=1 Tax=hydrocarbon metagenome TaxID=938273 RepID=A0A0W8FE81_9ZZZZ